MGYGGGLAQLGVDFLEGLFGLGWEVGLGEVVEVGFQVDFAELEVEDLDYAIA